MGHNSQLITWWHTSVVTEVERGCEEEGVPHKMFATSKAILETSAKLSIEVDGAVVRLVFPEEGSGSSIKMKCYYLLRVEERARGIQISLCIHMPPAVHCRDM